ncbi:Uncharacterised protein [Neisseria meningitidis]|nr:Uncharacterised protein [Neisseria meningitidis]CWP87673.1 Uncharacterised protein [Neisseria meningitidis]CWP95961.1 Uncharacterised protein [Neisseria meningitidis]CWQ21077.1 Uncharacterised protein [Neisseria meningitidis]CWT35734.1 Uncharacterised protein [Neisseria meningitidis]
MLTNGAPVLVLRITACWFLGAVLSVMICAWAGNTILTETKEQTKVLSVVLSLL